MTRFRRQVLQGVSNHEYEGITEVMIDLGIDDPLGCHNVCKAYKWLCSNGYINEEYSTLTDKSKEYLAINH